ncbi:DNA replication ATP-dependent helicase-like protein [Aphelenchoides fujianensis]|nr:DNA replication ATP-dependent helicase-like protein [Aphelenchoides fujianensis]
MLDESPLQKAGLKRRPPPLVLEDAKEAAVPPPQRARVEVFSGSEFRSSFRSILLIARPFSFVLLVQQVEVGGEGTRLKCRSFEDAHEEFGVRLRDLWANTPVRAGHTIRLLEAVRLGPHEFEVTNERGRLIVEPFNLLTATSIASSLYCKRKAVLQNRFRSGGTSRVMLIGCIVHETAITRTEAPTPDSLLEFCRAIAFRKYGVELLLNDVDLPLLECDLRPYLRNIAAWLRKHTPRRRLGGGGEPLGLRAAARSGAVRAVESVEQP